MDCHEAEKKLTKQAGDLLTADEEKALLEHLNRCPACARLALAERLLAHDLEQLSHMQPHRSMTVEQVREAIAIRKERYKTTRLGVRIMRQVSNTIYTRRRLSLAMAAVLVLLFASVLVPIKTERPIGYQVAFAAPNRDLVLNRENAEKLLAALELYSACIAVNKADSEAEYVIAPLKDTAQVQRLTMVLDSLGGRRVRSVVAAAKSEKRTIWQLLLDDNGRETNGSSGEAYDRESGLTTLTVFKRKFKDDFVLWLPGGDQQGDDLSGVLMDRQGEKTDLWLLGEEGSMAPDDCGWHQYLNNSVMNTETPDGKQVTFRLYEIEDVRRLEKMGYNFATMEWDAPRQIPIPGMGPRLNEITPDRIARGAVIEYMIPQAHEVRLQMLDKQGREICTLLDCIPLGGIHRITWDGRDDEGNQVRPGTYLCRFIAGDYVETQKIELER
jgi:hypothetical protein